MLPKLAENDQRLFVGFFGGDIRDMPRRFACGNLTEAAGKQSVYACPKAHTFQASGEHIDVDPGNPCPYSP
jgi:hypothetical protein